MQPAESTRHQCGSEMTAKAWALNMELASHQLPAPRQRWILYFGKICGPPFISTTTPLIPRSLLVLFSRHAPNQARSTLRLERVNSTIYDTRAGNIKSSTQHEA